jgi:hypothetical protein
MEGKTFMSQAIEIVVQVDEGVCLSWDASGTLAVAYTDEELGHWVMDALRNSNLPRVEAKAPSVLARTLAGLIPGANDIKGTAVHTVVVLARDGEAPAIVVWGSVGPPRHAKGVENIGKVMRELARDPAQPKVAGGAPEDIFGEISDRAIPLLGKYLSNLG